MEHLETGRQQFRTPNEELDYLRRQVADKERELEARGEKENFSRESVIANEIREYRSAPETVIDDKLRIKPELVDRIVKNLAPEDHDSQMEELIHLMQTKGVKNAFEVVRKTGSPHLDDDFHRYLVEYIKEGYAIPGLKEKAPLYKSLHTSLYEVSLPTEIDVPGREKNLRELISGMEQFYAGMLSVPGESNAGHGYFAIELAMENVGEEFAFYAAVPTDRKRLFEKHILSIFPDAKLTEMPGDYNVFNPRGASVSSVAHSGGNPIFTLKTHDKFENDPLNALLGSFSKIDSVGEGAAIQIVMNPVGGEDVLKRYRHALEKIQKGEDFKRSIDVDKPISHEIMRELASLFSSKKKDEKKAEQQPADPELVQNIQAKIGSPIMRANIRIVASSRTEREAEAILDDIQSAFNQFENTKGNRIGWKRVRGRGLSRILHQYSYRLFSDSESIPFNLGELATLMHFQSVAAHRAPTLRQSKAGSAPAPTGLPSEGVLLGVNRHRNIETKAYLTEEDRLRHLYVIGQTGTGKTTFLKNMIVQDIRAGHGVCFIDPHGSDVQDILASVPPERYGDVIYFDPSNVERPMALNMLEYDTRFPEQKTFVVNELFSIFQKLYGAVPESMGPMFEQYFRNATMLVIEDPETGSTLVDVSRVLSDKKYRDLKLSRCRNPIVVQFWKEIAEKAGGEGALANIVPYITSKFDVFLANDYMRPIIAQEKSSFKFREIMDGRKILLVNLAKGRLGDINANLIGLILVGKILMAALSRVDSFGKDMPHYHLFIDEFQNITTNSISTILSEARKYKLSLTMAHQFIAQLDEGIKNSVFGNVGSMAAFRVGAADAEALVPQFAPVFTANDLMNIDNRNCYVRLLAGGKPVRPFNIEVLPPAQTDPGIADKLRELSFATYGGDRAAIEEEIMRKYRKEPAVPPAAGAPKWQP